MNLKQSNIIKKMLLKLKFFLKKMGNRYLVKLSRYSEEFNSWINKKKIPQAGSVSRLSPKFQGNLLCQNNKHFNLIIFEKHKWTLIMQ